MALVNQEQTLFGCNIWENILYGNELATTEMVEASQATLVHDFIK